MRQRWEGESRWGEEAAQAPRCAGAPRRRGKGGRGPARHERRRHRPGLSLSVAGRAKLGPAAARGGREPRPAAARGGREAGGVSERGWEQGERERGGRGREREDGRAPRPWRAPAPPQRGRRRGHGVPPPRDRAGLHRPAMDPARGPGSRPRRCSSARGGRERGGGGARGGGAERAAAPEREEVGDAGGGEEGGDAGKSGGEREWEGGNWRPPWQTKLRGRNSRHRCKCQNKREHGVNAEKKQ